MRLDQDERHPDEGLHQHREHEQSKCERHRVILLREREFRSDLLWPGAPRSDVRQMDD
jgi:hypothetical protein